MSDSSSHPAMPAETSIYRPVAEGPGTRIGPYKLLQEIGEGGFGIVYMAEQQEPVRRKVALKIIKPGMDSKEVIARFESERQALALMDHPNIARVLDAGATETGRPYFVMELVRGVPITEYCDRNQLTARERLELFVIVCRAVQHAHQKGIIHRDIKPSNVMVTLHDGQPVPKVIDFGVAKATSQHLTERTLFTAYGQMVGTPAYMSPEQAEMSGLDIDTRSDIYSLGVLLYELLTGTTPFDMKRLRDAGYVEMQRIIREEEPQKPSTRISTLGEQQTVVASHRRTDPVKLRQLLRGDLDLIIMKALEKERTRRYETPNGFALDVEHYLRQEAIQARPPSALYRLRKFAQRNKAAVITASAIAVCLLLGTIVSSLLAVQAIWERNRAQENVVIADRERTAADTARRDAESQRDTAQRAKEAEEDQRRLAETRGREAEVARQAEAEQRALAEEKRRDIERQHSEIAGLNSSLQKLSDEQRRTLYTAQMNLAQKAWEADNVGHLLDLLDAQRPRPEQTDLRGFEWHYLNRLCNSDVSTVKLPLTLDSLIFSFIGRTVELSPDATRMMVIRHGTKGDALKVYDVDSTAEVLSLEIQDKPPSVGSPATESRGAGQLPFLTARYGFFLDRNHIAVVTPDLNGPRGAPQQAELTVYDIATQNIVYKLYHPTIAYVISPDQTRIGAVVTKAPMENKDALAAPERVNCSVKVWHAQTGDEIAEIPLPPGRWIGLALSTEGKRLAVSAYGRNFAFSGLSEVGLRARIKILDVDSREEIGTVDDSRAFAMAFTPDGSGLAAVTVSGNSAALARADGELYDVKSGERRWSIKLGSDVAVAYSSPVFSPDGRWLAFLQLPSFATSRSLTLHSPTTGEKQIALKGHTLNVVAASFASDGRHVSTMAHDGTVKRWELPAPSALISSFERPPTISTYDATHNLMAMVAKVNVPGRDQAAEPAPYDLSIRDAATQEMLWKQPLAGVAEQLVFSPDGRYLAVSWLGPESEGAERGHITALDSQTGKLVFMVRTLPIGRRAMHNAFDMGVREDRFAPAVAFSPDSRTLAITLPLKPAADVGWVLRLLDAASGDEIFTSDPQPGAGAQIEFSPDGSRILSQVVSAAAFALVTEKSTSRFGTPRATGVKAWDAASGRPLWQWNFVPTDVKWNRDGSRLCGYRNRKVEVFSAATGATLSSLPNIPETCVFTISPDGKRLVVAASETIAFVSRRPGPVGVWDVDTSTQLFSLPGHTAALTDVVFSPDGRRIATTAGSTAETRLWDAETGHELLTLPGADYGLNFSSDGRQLSGWASMIPYRRSSMGSYSRPLVLADASPLPPEIEARQLVNALGIERANDPLTRGEIRRLIADDASASAEAKARAQELAGLHRRDSKSLTTALQTTAWNVVKLSNEPRRHYERALEFAMELCETTPSSVEAWTTRGAAHYRLGEHESAIAALNKAIELRQARRRELNPKLTVRSSDLTGVSPDIFVFLAMAHHALGHGKEANEFLTKSDETINRSGSSKVSEWRGLLAQAQALLAQNAIRTPARLAPIADWGEPTDPRGDCAFTVSSGSLTITVPGNLHSLSPVRQNYDAPRVLKELEGDFTVQLQVTCPIEPQKGLTEHTLSYQGAGLLLWGGDDHFLRIERNGYIQHSSYGLGSILPSLRNLKAKVASNAPLIEYWHQGREVTAGRNVWNSSKPRLPGDSTWLRVMRRGSIVNIALSHDGQMWQEADPVETALPTKIQLGVVAINGTGDEFRPVFSDFRLSQP